MDDFEYSKEINGSGMPDDIENLNEILAGINVQIWEDLGMTQQEWFQKTVRYKKPDRK